MYKNYKESLTRMHSEDIIKLAEFYYDKRSTHVSTNDIHEALGIEKRGVSQIRRRLEQYFGYRFHEIYYKRFKLIDVTLERDMKITRDMKRQQEKRKEERRNGGKILKPLYTVESGSLSALINGVFR